MHTARYCLVHLLFVLLSADMFGSLAKNMFNHAEDCTPIAIIVCSPSGSGGQS